MTEKEMIVKHGSENMCDLPNQEQAELKKAMIDEMAVDVCEAMKVCAALLCCACDFNGTKNQFECRSKFIARRLAKKYQPKIPEGAIVLTEGEYSDLLFDEVATLKRDIAEYWANADFENVVKELHKGGYRKLDDHAIFVLRKAKSLEEKVRKETAEKIVSEIKKLIESEWTINKATYENLCSKLNELAKQFGIEIKE
jgi:hypothetical protein